ncbi:hypothetical protein C0991_008717 [Blastosporella zonata]|nr:hypothetical protein C0991_008717 [Blastosporella zonata]
MSQTKTSMLSTTHTIFCGLQDHIKTIISKLPDNINITIKSGLLAAHQKLSEYYYWFDQSPFYTWAAVLDPRIMYEGLKEEYTGNIGLTKYLKEMKDQLQKYYEDFYANHMEPLSHTNSTSTSVL